MNVWRKLQRKSVDWEEEMARCRGEKKLETQAKEERKKARCAKDGRATENAMRESGIQNDPHASRRLVHILHDGQRSKSSCQENSRDRSRMSHCRVPILLDADARTVQEESAKRMAAQQASYEHMNSSRAVGNRKS